MRRVMNAQDIDKKRAFRNPWGLTICQCYTLRLICEHGGTKRAAHATDENYRIMEHHLMSARKKMNLLGTDIRLYIKWDRWTRKDEGEDDE
jgi:hypothetical protein